MILQESKLTGLRTDPAIARDDDEVERGDLGNPDWIQGAERDVRDEGVSYVDEVSSCDRERLPQAEDALVGEETKVLRIGWHPSITQRRRCGSAHT